jgi:hypothetical protein
MRRYKTEGLIGIPQRDISEVVEDFKSEGAQVEIILQQDGNWTARAEFFKETDDVHEVAI